MIIPASPDAYAQAARTLRAGGLVALPTETVYGLAGDAANPDAVARIYALKGRPASNPLITHVTHPGEAGGFGVMNRVAQTLAGRFWPGPLTLVVERRASHLATGAGANLPTIALRCPRAAWTAHIPGPLVMPSANRSGHVSPTTAEHVAFDFGPDLLVVDAGPCSGGIESTVVRAVDTHARILRPGAIPADALAAVVPLHEEPLDEGSSDGGGPTGSPGFLLKHYAPAAPLRMNATVAREHEWHIGFGGGVGGGFGGVAGDVTLSATGDLREAARSLYAALREADTHARAIAVAPIPDTGLGRALNDRLRRAARGR